MPGAGSSMRTTPSSWLRSGRRQPRSPSGRGSPRASTRGSPARRRLMGGSGSAWASSARFPVSAPTGCAGAGKASIHRSAWKECSKKLPCENREKANEEEAHAPVARGGDRLGRLHRPQPADGGEGKVRRLRREAARASGERVLRGRGDGGAGWHGRRPGPERDGGLRGLPPILITRGLRTSPLRSSEKFAHRRRLPGNRKPLVIH